ncbi:MAG: DUF4142 domain-containing protein [Pseudomonadota bacterium]
MSKLTIRQRLFGAAAFALLFGTLAAQAQTSQSPASGTAAQGTPASTSGTAGATTSMDQSKQAGASGKTGVMNKSDHNMLSQLAQANMAEIEAGRLAQSKSQNAQVKSYAQQMIDDHTKALQEVQQLAQAKGVTLPTETDRKHQKLAQRLGALSGDAFDRRYMDQSGVADHKQTHSLLQRVQARASDPDLKALAARLQPTVEQHMTSTQQLTAAMKNSGTATGGSGTMGTSGAGAPGKSGDTGNSGKQGTSGATGTNDPAGAVKPGT